MNADERAPIEVRELRCLVAIVDTGTFTDAGIELRMSQAAVSRNLAALERKVGARLLRRTTRQVEPTAAGERALRTARGILAGIDELVADARKGPGIVRLGYAWSAAGAHTIELQRRWPLLFPDTALELVRVHSPSAGVAEGRADFAIVRRAPDGHTLDAVRVGSERRFCAMADNDPWMRRRSISLADIATRTVAIDGRTGTTTLELWPEAARPAQTIEVGDIDDWLTAVASGRAVGISSEATVHQYRRPGVGYRPVRDAPPIEVFLAWARADPPPVAPALAALLAELYRGAGPAPAS